MPNSEIQVFEYNGTLLGTDLVSDSQTILLGDFSTQQTGELADNDGTLEAADDGISTFESQTLT